MMVGFYLASSHGTVGRFQSFIEKSVEKRKALVVNVSYCPAGTLEGCEKIRRDLVARGKERPSTDFFTGRENPSIPSSEMTIRPRGWLGKCLFIAQVRGNATECLWTIVDTLESSE